MHHSISMLGAFAVIIIANAVHAHNEKIAFCVGDLNNGQRVEIAFFRTSDGEGIRGLITKDGRTVKTRGALDFNYRLNNPDTRPGMVEFKFQSSLTFAAHTRSFYTMIMYVNDNHQAELRGKQFIHYFDGSSEPLFGNLDCAGNFILVP